MILPSRWGGQERLFEGIRELRVLGGSLQGDTVPRAGASPEEGDGSRRAGVPDEGGEPGSPPESRAPDEDASGPRRIVTHEPGAELRVLYRFVQDRPADFSDHGRTHRPLLEAGWFHFIGHGAFVHPDWSEDDTRPITLRWEGLPSGWALADSFGAGETRQDLDITIDQLRHALYVGGDFRVHRLLVRDRPVFVALRGEWRFSDRDYTGMVADIIRAQREFWGDHRFPHYLVTMIPMGTKCCSFGGTSVTNAFATFIATDGGLDMRMKHLLAHELMHTWIGQKMRNASSPEEPEALLYWFSEGFTDYYTRELLLRSEQITPEEYAEDLNRKIYDYWTSPVRDEPNARIAEDYWRDRHVGQLPYTRGELLARRWDAAIREATGGRSSLHDAMLRLLARAEGEGERVTEAGIRAAVEGVLGRDVGDDLRRFVRDGEPVPPAPGSVAGHLLREVEMVPFDLGFDFGASRRAGETSGVRQGGPAWKAGLREGLKLRGFGIHWDDASQPVVIRVEIDGQTRAIEYLPAGDSVLVPQYARSASGTTP